jgi:hypothetical protein
VSEPYWEPLAAAPLGLVQGMVPIQRIELGAAAASIDFQNIPQNYHHLRLVITARGDAAAAAAGLLMRFNNDSGANYDRQQIDGTDTTVAASSTTAQTSAVLGNIPAATALAGQTAAITCEIPNYGALSFFKGANIEAGMRYTSPQRQASFAQWRSTAAINRITLLLTSGNFVAGSVATLYGILDTPIAAGAPSSPGFEFAYAENPNSVTVSATTEAGANVAVTAPSVTFDGVTPVIVTFECPRGTAGTSVLDLFLFDNGVSIGKLSRLSAASAVSPPVHVTRRLLPTAGAHVFSIRSMVDGGSGSLLAGPGGVGQTMPMYMRVVRA